MARELRKCRVSVGLTQEEKDTLERMANESGLSVSRVAQEAVMQFIKNHSITKVDIINKPGRLRLKES